MAGLGEIPDDEVVVRWVGLDLQLRYGTFVSASDLGADDFADFRKLERHGSAGTLLDDEALAVVEIELALVAHLVGVLHAVGGGHHKGDILGCRLKQKTCQEEEQQKGFFHSHDE